MRPASASLLFQFAVAARMAAIRTAGILPALRKIEKGML
jgi:hypothetical protein